MTLKEIIERGLREGMRRYNAMIKKSTTCARDNMLIRAQLEAIQQELMEAKEDEQ